VPPPTDVTGAAALGATGGDSNTDWLRREHSSGERLEVEERGEEEGEGEWEEEEVSCAP